MASIDEKTLNFLRENQQEFVYDDELTKYQYIDNKLIITPLEVLNTKVHQKEIQEELSRFPIKSRPTAGYLLHSWKLLLKDYNQFIPNNVKKQEEVLNPLSSFRYSIGLGYYPPPETLLALLDCFETYFHLAGKVELEQIFFGDRKIGIGNHSARVARENIMKHFHAQWLAIKNGTQQRKTQTKLAEEIIEK